MQAFKKAIDLDMALVILSGLRRAGYTCGIVGGYARDTFFDIPPKDLDICVAMGTEPDYYGVDAVIEEVRRALEQEFYREKVVPHMNIAGMYNDHASDRACGVFQFPDHGIDVILYKDCVNMQEVIESFDFNINQFGMDGEYDDEPRYLGSTPLVAGLVKVRDDCSEDRAIKVARKYAALFEKIVDADEKGRFNE